jgi:hypothetical protein
MRTQRKTFLYVFTHLLARNEMLYSTNKKTLTDEMLIIELTNFDFGEKSKRLEQLLDPSIPYVTLGKLRGQFNRGELHQGSLNLPPKFFSFRYSEDGKRLSPRGKLLSPEQQNDMIRHFQAQRARWRQKQIDRVQGQECEPKFLLPSKRSSVIGPNAPAAGSAPTA